MKIRLSDAGKRFNREWIFRHASLNFESPGSYAITGPNGSGKSTLLQTIGGMLQPSEGKVDFLDDEQPVSADSFYRHISFCAPYLEVPEEMTLREFLQFHGQFKSFREGLTHKSIMEAVGLRGGQADP
jgi:ABC-type multidrug transport system ATPase subunit